MPRGNVHNLSHSGKPSVDRHTLITTKNVFTSRGALASGGRPRLVSRTAIGGERCSCGTPLTPGARAFSFVGVPELVSSLVQSRTFCSPMCARSFLLETMEMFESTAIGSVVGDSEAIASALRLLYIYTPADPERNAGPSFSARG